MGPEFFWMGGMWMFPISVIVALLVVIYLIFGRGTARGPWSDSDHAQGPESALDILKKRYARGEISKEEFAQIKKDLLQ
ncbi:SHOCT domain-containing protein [Desulfotalea psychrophila]|uniref:SHOCT domain-containing protein n=1 Tax=Desulfotalea psychrophila TaxID=84980 RepID=UPI000303209D|nr:SHOCT domain-containing protein [Desulfotalea psychrophila]